MVHATGRRLLLGITLAVKASWGSIVEYGSIGHGAAIDKAALTRGTFIVTGIPAEFTSARARITNQLTTECKETIFGFRDETKQTLALYAGETSQVPDCLSLTDILTVDSVMQKVSQRLAEELDVTLLVGDYEPHVTLEVGQRLSRLAEIIAVDGGRHHLDHWNLYKKPVNSSSSSSGDAVEKEEPVEMHADMGLFLLLSLPRGDKALHFAEGPVELPGTGDSLVVIFGEALRSWLAPGIDVTAALHKVVVPADGSSGPRVVFGRMMMAPPTAINSAGLAYQQFFMAPQAFQSRRMLSQCAAGQVYCWLRCMTPPEGCPAENAVCWDFRKSDLCDMSPGKMNPDCALRHVFSLSIDVTAEETVKEDNFCESSTDMIMSGFQFLWSEHRTCIILFLHPLVLNTRLKFALGMLAVFCLGIVAEASMRLRKRTENSLSTSRSTLRGKMILVLLFSINLILAYMAMLVAMTYSAELFLSVVLGVAVGRIFLSNDQRGDYRSDAVDPCCAALSSDGTEAAGSISPHRRRSSDPSQEVYEHLVTPETVEEGVCPTIHILSSYPMFYRHPGNSYVTQSGQHLQHFQSAVPGGGGVHYIQQQQQHPQPVRSVSGQVPSSNYVRQYAPVNGSANNMSSMSNAPPTHHTTSHLSPRPPQYAQHQQLPHYTTTGAQHQTTTSQNSSNNKQNGQPVNQLPRVQVVNRASSMNMSAMDQSGLHGHQQQHASQRGEDLERALGKRECSAEVDRVREKLESVERKLQDAGTRLQQKEEEAKRLRADIESYKVSEGQFKAALSKLRAENESLATAASASRGPDPKVAELSRRLEGRTAELKRTQNELSSAEERLRRSKQELETTISTLKETKEELESMKSHFEAQNQEQSMLVTETEALRAHIDKMEEALQSAAQENQMLQVELNSFTTERSELKVLQEQLRNVEHERDLAMATKDTIVARESALRMDLEASKKEAIQAIHRAELAETAAEGRAIKEQVGKTSNLSHLKQSTTGSQSDGGDSSAAAAMVRKNRELEDLREQLDDAHHEIASLKTERDALEEARRAAEEKLLNINMSVTEASSKNKIVGKLHAEVSDLKREIGRLQDELSRYKDMSRNKENRASEFNIGFKSKYLNVTGADLNATLSDIDGGRYSKVTGSPFADTPAPQKTQRAVPSDSSFIKSPPSSKKHGGRHSSGGGKKSKDSPVKIVRARGLLNNLTDSDPIIAKAVSDDREAKGLSKEECYELIEKLMANHEIPVRVKRVTCTQVFRTIVDNISQPPPANLPSAFALDYCKKAGMQLDRLRLHPKLGS
ncbi:hypothetical protein FOL47_010393 [Perkinsus chesapeaki]|uniref:Uncharacterized protein n=1 Tax=Perkinsus chesapeaki TaxID=330153 RepID=A0A7J6MQA8_PERCH|nr:hypothetical protein FOL47_010393 [Perkinsus chesapeaki]